MSELTWTAIQITGIGMLGIFIFMGIFYGIIILLRKLFPVKDA